MAKTNIERFDEISADILAHLYQAFPIPTAVTPSVAGLTELKVLNQDPVSEASVNSGERDPETEFFDASLAWLAHSGFILKKDGGHFRATYVLTAYGLQALKHVPTPSLGSETLGEKLSSAARSGATGAAKEAMNQAVSIGMQLLARSAGLP
ncbi:hypothetical protein [Pseudomonas monteilii]|nr:hypothetical protein [Pseudomonas monteilii]